MPFLRLATLIVALGCTALAWADVNKAEDYRPSSTIGPNGPQVTARLETDTSDAATIVPAEGVWWASPAGAESGWGINVSQQAGALFLTWFTFAPDGSTWWIVAQATKTTGNTYAGSALSGTGPAFSSLPFNPALVKGTVVGTVALTFTDVTHATFNYTINGTTQTKAIELQVFGTSVPTCTWSATPDLDAATNYQDMWWASPAGTESGWGLNISHQGDSIFAAWFTFATNGKPMWLVFSAQKVAAQVYTGKVVTGTGPPLGTVPFDPSAVHGGIVGDATLTFSDGNHATFAYSIFGVTQTKSITREIYGPAASGTVCSTPVTRSSAEGFWKGTTDKAQVVHALILDDGTLYWVYTAPGSTHEAGVLYGTTSSVNGAFATTNLHAYTFSPGFAAFSGGAQPLDGTYAPQATLHATNGTSSLTASYDAGYDHPTSFADMAGTYSLAVGHVTEENAATANMDATGHMTIDDGGCVFGVVFTQRGSSNVFDVNISLQRGGCYKGPGTAYYDATEHKIYIMAQFQNTLLGFADFFRAIGIRQ